jgi:hypothetical protein
MQMTDDRESLKLGKWYQTDDKESIKAKRPSGEGFCWLLLGNGRHLVIDSRRINLAENPNMYPPGKLTQFNRALSIAESEAVSREFIMRLFTEKLESLKDDG